MIKKNKGLNFTIGRKTLSPLPPNSTISHITPRLRRTSLFISNQRSIQRKVSLEQFRLMRTVGTGTFARVRLARNIATDEIIVIKMMYKSQIIQMRQVEHIKSEKKALQEFSHPFIAKLIGTQQDRKRLYLFLEYIPGGELYKHLRINRMFTVPTAKFYAAEVVSAFSYIHSQNAVYRDLKPENILLSKEGHIKFVDFGFTKFLTPGEYTYTLCGTPEYLPPEVILQNGHHLEADWWTLGILLFEMLVGRPPFEEKNPYNIYKKIISSEVAYPENLDEAAHDLISKLLMKDPKKRISEEAIKRHAFFRGINWRDVDLQCLNPPIVPIIRAPDDSSNFDKYKEEEDPDIADQIAAFDMFPDF
ncbi:unnamed protein product [Blepharisma stoltei]|uniref:cAMP-dependent protein kinase catalytic subunit n=1 Tax=Blepharisma stoltei TaxID=1481888 RepID=A0AAU9IZM6_9CILI|nr:unnamed protein product [Blepharisma stoltei]